MSCSSCKYLDSNKENPGKFCGCCYYCTKKKCYVNGSNNKCEEFEITYGRNSYECNKIYEAGEHYSDDTTPLLAYLLLLIILSIMSIIVNIL